MKLLKIITSIIFILSLWVWSVYWWGSTPPPDPSKKTKEIIEIDNNIDWEANDRDVIKDKFDEFYKAGEKDWANRIAKLWEDWWWTNSINNFLINIAKSLKDLFMIILSLYLIISVIKMLLAESSQDEFDKLKTSLIWTSMWIILMQVSYKLVTASYDRDIWSALWWVVLQNVINPLINLVLYITWFLFMFAAVFSFYKLITSDWDESRWTEWKMWVFYAVIWVVIVKISQTIIRVFYWDVYNCTWWPKCDLIAANSRRDSIWWTESWVINDYSTFVDVVVAIINWTNSFVSIIVVILIIYAWAMVLFSNGNSENLDKAKRSVLYIAIWLFIIVASYLILNFFIIR